MGECHECGDKNWVVICASCGHVVILDESTTKKTRTKRTVRGD